MATEPVEGSAAGRVAVVTGANRGVGLAVSTALAERGATVFLTGRDAAAAESAALPLRARGLDVRPLQLDVTEPAAVEALARRVEAATGRADILVNNAAAYYERGERTLSADLDMVRAALEVNLLGCWRMALALVPLMLRGGYGRIVNVSARLGAFGTPQARTPGRSSYAVSKAALNMLTVKLAVELAGSGVLVNAGTPGQTRTRMGGPDAPRSPEEGADTLVWLALLPPDGPTGGFFMDRKPLPW